MTWLDSITWKEYKCLDCGKISKTNSRTKKRCEECQSKREKVLAKIREDKQKQGVK